MRVMIVDNDHEFTDELAEVLHDAGYEIKAFVDSVVALNAVHWVKPAVIVLDLVMNKINGYQAAWYLRKFQETASIPIIGMSGYADKFDPEQVAAACGMSTFLRKPFYPLDIIAKIEQYTAGPQAAAVTDKTIEQLTMRYYFSAPGPEQRMAWARDGREHDTADNGQAKAASANWRQTALRV